MEKARNLIFLGLLILLFVEVLIVFPSRLGRKADPVPVPATNSNEVTGPAEQQMRGIHLLESQRGARDWELFSEQANGNQDRGNWSLRKVKVLFYSKENAEFTVTGDEGDIDNKTKDMSIRGHVTTTSVNGYVFTTESVHYDAQKRRISSPSKVDMQGPPDQDGAGMHVTGTTMDVDVEESRMVIPKDVRANKPLSGRRQMSLQSNRAEFSGQSQEVRFVGDVQMEYDRIKLEGPEAAFLKAGKGDFLSNIRFSGGVKVSDDDKFATSENLDLDLVENKIVFRGQPKVYQGKDELSGEQIIFLDGGKKVKVEKVRAQMEKNSP